MTTTTAQRHPTTATRSRTWVRTLGRTGIASRGVIYVILAYLAFDIARHGTAPAQTTSTGALEEVGRREGGSDLLILLAVGLGSYAVWRLVDAVASSEGLLKRLGSVAIAVVYFGLLVRAIQLAVGHQANAGASANPQPMVAKVLGWPGGKEIVGVGGVVLVIAGVALAVWGLFHRYTKTLALERVGRGWQRIVRTLGVSGDVARGFLIALVGTYLIGTAASNNPGQAKGIDQALKSLVHHPYGAIVIGAVSLGLLCFGLYSFFEARLRRF